MELKISKNRRVISVFTIGLLDTIKIRKVWLRLLVSVVDEIKLNSILSWSFDLLSFFMIHSHLYSVKGALSGLGRFLATEKSPIKLIKNAFYITLKALFVLKVLKFLSWLFGHVGKRLEYSQTFFFKIKITHISGSTV